MAEQLTKSELLEAFDALQQRYKFTQKKFSEKYNVSESTFSRWRRHDSIDSPKSREAVIRLIEDSQKYPRATSIANFPHRPIGNVYPSLFVPPVISQTVSTPRTAGISEISPAEKADLIRQYMILREKYKFTDRDFSKRYRIKDLTQWIESPDFVCESCEKAIRRFLIEDQGIWKQAVKRAHTRDQIQEANLRIIYPTQEDKEYSGALFSDVIWWATQKRGSFQKKLVLIDADNAEQSMYDLNKIPPPSEDVLVILFVKVYNYEDVAKLWSDVPYVIVRSSRSDDRDASDVSMTFVTSILASRLIPIVDEGTVSLEFVLVSDDSFVSDLRNEVFDLGMPCVVISRQYVDLGLYLARRMGYSPELYRSLPLVILTNQLAQRISPENPLTSWEEILSLMNDIGLTWNHTRLRRDSLIGELVTQGLYKFVNPSPNQ
jgi:hypothetical protein